MISIFSAIRFDSNSKYQCWCLWTVVVVVLSSSLHSLLHLLLLLVEVDMWSMKWMMMMVWMSIVDCYHHCCCYCCYCYCCCLPSFVVEQPMRCMNWLGERGSDHMLLLLVLHLCLYCYFLLPPVDWALTSLSIASFDCHYYCCCCCCCWRRKHFDCSSLAIVVCLSVCLCASLFDCLCSVQFRGWL